MPDREHKLRGSDPRLNEPRARGDTRILDLKSGRWQWKINGNTAFIYSPEDKRTEVPLYDVLDMSKADWDNYQANRKIESTISITPKDISNYINEKILGSTLVKTA